MLILNAEDVRRALPYPDAIEGMKRAYAALTTGRVVAPPRAHLKIAPHDGVSLVMPAFVDDREGQALAVKVVSLFDHNLANGLARIQAAVMAFEPHTGRPLAVLDGAALTAIRTASGSAAAADLLARADATTLAVFGAGVQARSHIRAVAAIRELSEVRVFSRTPAKVDALLAEFAEEGGFAAELRRADSPADALRGADIVCTTTTSSEPVFEDADLPDGVHISAVGSYQPHVRELPSDTVRRALVFVDQVEAAWEEAGDLIQPLEAGQIGREHIHAELGELVIGTKSGRSDSREVTLFKSVGVAVQDAVAAQVALRNAAQQGLGQAVDW